MMTRLRPQGRAVFLALFAGILALSGTPARAATTLRWTYQEDHNAKFDHILAKINAQTTYGLSAADFRITDDRDLAFTHYQRYEQIQNGVAVQGMSIRIWTTLRHSNHLVQLEAQVETPTLVAPDLVDSFKDRASTASALAEADAAMSDEARAAVERSNDPAIVSMTRSAAWRDGRLLSVFRIKTRHGKHVIEIDVAKKKIVTDRFTPYQDHGGHAQAETSFPALIYPIYEEYNGQPLPRKQVELKYLLPTVTAPTEDPFAPLRDRQYLNKKEDAVLGATPAGQAQGYWSMEWLKSLAAQLLAAAPQADNSLTSGHALLQGRYATINIHPAAFAAYPGITIPKAYGSQLLLNWQKLADDSDWEAIPSASYYGKPLEGPDAALNRDATFSPLNDPTALIDSGFDEVQVYYSINQLFESLRPMGFSDPEFSETPFHAFLFDPDIENADNAFYTDGTINFSTYPATHLNMARDNTTIWHELGHGVMDRLMGPGLDLADTGGLSEGMADFVAELVIRETNGDAPFPGQDDQRIINGTGFYLTNEVHDDGEAYGGAMKAILDAAITRYGRDGLVKVTDLVLEAMRLSRDNPALTADDWFNHILFADQLGRKGVRHKGELKALIEAALAARNFAPTGERAEMSLKYQGVEVAAATRGSRGHEVPLTLAATEQSTQPIDVELKDGNTVKFKYPVTVKVFYNAGPLQGAIDWVGEDQEPAVFTIAQAGDVLHIPLTVNGKCDEINRTDGTCSDFAYVQIFNDGETRPVAKKRFYLRIKTTP